MISKEALPGYLKSSWDESIARGEPYPDKLPFTVLYGTWNEMGKQYGLFQGKYIRIVYDALYLLWVKSGIKNSSLRSAMKSYVDKTRVTTPEMMDFIAGVAEGASNDLDNAMSKEALSNLEKIFFVNSLFELTIPSCWELLAETTGEVLSKESLDFMRSLQAPNEESSASHAWAAWGSATKSGGSIAGGARDQPWFPLLYSCSYVAVPSDNRANITFVNTISGVIAGSAQLNEKGLFVANTIVEKTWNPKEGIREQGVGVPALIATAHASFFANTAQEAAAMITSGLSGTKEIFPYTVGFNQLFADKREGLVVERTAHRYLVRRAEESGELGSYIVLTNHNVGKKSNSIEGESEDPMNRFGAGESFDRSSAARYWSLIHLIGSSLGKVDLEFAMDKLENMKYIFTKDGKRIDSINGIPVWRLGLSPQRFLFRNPKDDPEFPYGGSLTSTVADLASLDVYYVLGIPEYWTGPWQHVSLANPAYGILRKKL